MGVVALLVAQLYAALQAVDFFRWRDWGRVFDLNQVSIPMLIGWSLGSISLASALWLCGKARLQELVAVFAYWVSFIPTVWVVIGSLAWLGATYQAKGGIRFRL